MLQRLPVGNSFMILLFLAGMLWLGCDKDVAGKQEEPEIPRDSIAIQSIDPQFNIPDDSLVTFTCVVYHQLGSAKSGNIRIGFNNQFGYYNIAYVEQLAVDDSNHLNVMVAQARTKHWTIDRPLKAFVSLHDSTGSQLAADSVNLDVLFDYVRIISVTPDSNLLNGAYTELAVSIEYSLRTVSSGMIRIGDNTRSATGAVILHTENVSAPSGSFTATVTAKPRYWAPPNSYKMAAILDDADSNFLYWFDFPLHALNTPRDSIIIVSVQPNTGLVDGVSTDFTVVVRYNYIYSHPGKIVVGFNNLADITHFRIYDELYITAGHETHTFNITAEAKDWNTSGTFKAGVFLHETPSNIAEESDTLVLSF